MNKYIKVKKNRITLNSKITKITSKDFNKIQKEFDKAVNTILDKKNKKT